ncbi:unnamed protein product [Ilex paraguariensis]|uniref:Uncharacterized protein n=1 Tax=Ilex paraguariensis TaxID=185542 RepID=A0ABC8SEA4_9AQUA
MNACLVFKGHTVASAIQVTTFHVPVVQYPSSSVASGHTPNALTKSLAVEVVAAFNFLHAPIALAVDRCTCRCPKCPKMPLLPSFPTCVLPTGFRTIQALFTETWTDQ